MKSLKYFIFFIAITGCLQNGVEQVRVVDSSGKPAKINKIVPKFNEEQMLKQKEAFNNNKEANVEVNKFRQDFNNVSQPINKNSSLASDISDQNFIVPKNNNYPNDIFADRITNYNYIEDSKNINQQNIKKDTKTKASSRQDIINYTNNEVIEGDIVDAKIDKKVEEKSANKLKSVNQQSLTELQSKTIKNNQASKTQSSTKNISNKKQYYIQIGIYSEKKNADSAYNKYSKISFGRIEEYNTKDKKKYKVLLGPYNNRKTAEQNLEKVIKTGHYDVYITEKK